MSTGRDPRSGYSTATRRPAGGVSLFSGPNVPYFLMVVVALAVLIPFLMLAEPFTAGGSTTAESSTTAAVETTTTTAPTDTSGGETTTTNSTVAIATSGLAQGEALFNGTCIVCHGAGGVGIEGLGKPLTTSTFIAELTDDELLSFLIVGRSDTDPLNTTGIAMPARGGNTDLTDADLLDVVAYLRTINN